MKKRYVLVIPIVLVIYMLVCVIQATWSSRNDVISAEKCPVSVAFLNADRMPGASVVVYSKTSGLHTVDSIRDNADLLGSRLLGYHKKSRSWIAYLTSLGSDNCCIAQVKNGTLRKIVLAGLPATDNLVLASVIGSDIVVPVVKTGKLLLYRYGIDGCLKSRSILSVPNDIVREVWMCPVTAGRGGLIAVALHTSNQPNVGIYLFNKRGVLLQRIAEGISPTFDEAGSRLAYIDTVMAVTDSTSGPAGGSNKLVIYDVDTRTRKLLATKPPKALTIGIPQILSGGFLVGAINSDGFDPHWSPDGKWVLLIYNRVLAAEFAVFAVTVDSSKPKWCRLPVLLSGSGWCVGEFK